MRNGGEVGKEGERREGEADVDAASLHEPVWWEMLRAPLRKTSSVLSPPHAFTPSSPPSPAYLIARSDSHPVGSSRP